MKVDLLNAREAAEPAESTAEEIGYGFRDGRPSAVREVVARVERIVSYSGFGIPGTDREDIQQEVMKQLWRAANQPGFDPEAGFWGFVDSVATRRCIDWFRRRRRASTEILEETEMDARPGPLHQALKNERLALANEVLATLEAPCRDLLELRVRRQLSFSEISRRVGRSSGALRVQFHRCIDRARKRMLRIRASGPN